MGREIPPKFPLSLGSRTPAIRPTYDTAAALQQRYWYVFIRTITKKNITHNMSNKKFGKPWKIGSLWTREEMKNSATIQLGLAHL